MKEYKIASIAGNGIANPIGQIWSGVLMLDHLGEIVASEKILKFIEATLSERKYRMFDLGGNASAKECAERIIENL